jgi:hypothetical protein
MKLNKEEKNNGRKKPEKMKNKCKVEMKLNKEEKFNGRKKPEK